MSANGTFRDASGPVDPDATSAAAAKRRRALVLSGGGTKGAFEVGALAFVVQTQAYLPDVLCATSAGSILAAVLAQARTPAEFADCVAVLRADLLAMTTTEVVFGTQPWLAEFDGTPLGDAITTAILGRTRPRRPEDPTEVPAGDPAGDPADDPADASTDADAGAGPVPLPSPDAPPNPSVPTTRRRHARWSTFVDALGEFPHVLAARKVARGHMGSIFTLDPLAAAFGGTNPDSPLAPIDQAKAAAPGMDVRLTITALGAGETRYVCGDGTIVGPDVITPLPGDAGRTTFLDGVLASSSAPMVFPPRAFAGEVYCDGGVLENIPVPAAVALGADDILAVLAVPLALPQPDPPVDWTQANALSVYFRSVGMIGLIDRQRQNLQTALPDGTRLRVVVPTVDVVSPFEVEAGLMLLDMDYGWLRAADILGSGSGDDVDPATRAAAQAASDRIVVAREVAFYREAELLAAAGFGQNASTGTVSPEALAHLGAIKREVAAAVAARRATGLPMPAGADDWARGWEHHGAVTVPPEGSGLPTRFDG